MPPQMIACTEAKHIQGMVTDRNMSTRVNVADLQVLGSSAFLTGGKSFFELFSHKLVKRPNLGAGHPCTDNAVSKRLPIEQLPIGSRLAAFFARCICCSSAYRRWILMA